MSLSKLLEDPFGPYPDEYILNPKWPRRGFPERPTLFSVQMKCGGTDIGLDETELLDEPPPSSRFVKNPVEVTGVLEIDKLHWLSDKGREWLAFDLRRRDDKMKIAGKPSELTLEAVYGDGVNSGSKIFVWLKFNKSMSAAYMTLNDDPKALVLFATDQNRSFRIESLDPQTYILSRNFLERYTLRRLIHELIDGSDTPIPDRNIDWLVERYFMQVVPMDKHIRYIFKPNTVNVSTNSRGALKLKAARRPRTVHKAEVVRFFARQADWLLADQIISRMSPNARYLDIPQWYMFVKQIMALNRQVRELGAKPVGYMDHTDDIAKNLTKFGGSQEEWRRRIDNALANPLHWQQKKDFKKPMKEVLPRVPVVNFRSTSLSNSVPLVKKSTTPLVTKSTTPLEKSFLHPRILPAMEYHYDDDFSDASTPPVSDSEPDTDEEGLLRKVPWYCREPPGLEPSQHIWCCPGCRNYHIDLLQPDEEDLEEIPEEYAQLLRSRDWQKVTEPEVVQAFGYLVNNHYAKHMRDLGIQIVLEDNKAAVRKWSPEDKRRKSRRLNT